MGFFGVPERGSVTALNDRDVELEGLNSHRDLNLGLSVPHSQVEDVPTAQRHTPNVPCVYPPAMSRTANFYLAVVLCIRNPPFIEIYTLSKTESVLLVSLHQVTRQQKVGNTLLDSILMPTVLTNQLPLRDLRLKQQMMQILQHLLIRLQFLRRRRLLRQLRKAQLHKN